MLVQFPISSLDVLVSYQFNENFVINALLVLMYSRKELGRKEARYSLSGFNPFFINSETEWVLAKL